MLRLAWPGLDLVPEGSCSPREYAFPQPIQTGQKDRLNTFPPVALAPARCYEIGTELNKNRLAPTCGNILGRRL